MTLPDGPRQLIASALSAAAFLGLFLGAALVWWAALALAVVTYFALLLILRRRPALSEVMLAERVTAQDVKQAAQALQLAGTRLTRAAEVAPTADRPDLSEMARHVLSIRTLVMDDPEDYRVARSFIEVHLPRIVETVETYVTLSQRAQDGNAARLADLGSRIRAFGPVVRKIDQACLSNDFDALDSEVEALGFQLKRIGGSTA